MRTWLSILALAAALAGQAPPEAAQAAAPPPRTAPSLPAVTPEEALLDNVGARAGVKAEVAATGDPDEDATLAARADADRKGILAIKAHETDLRTVMDHMPTPFVRVGSRGGKTVYRGDSMADCVGYATRRGKGVAGEFVCAGNPYPTAAFYLGSYYNELGRPDDGLTVLDKGLLAAPDSPLLISERNASLIALGRVVEVLEAADRGLRIANLSIPDHARLLRNRGYALTELGRLDDAEQAYKNALALQPDNALARNELTYIARLKAGQARTPGGMIGLNPPSN